MPVIVETNNFIIKGHDQPHHDRDNGGHAVVVPKQAFSDRTQMPINLYLEMMQWVLIAGEAITSVMRRKGIPVVRANYQDNGNWAYFPQSAKEPHVHVHLYIRSEQEVHPKGDKRFRPFPHALFFPYIVEDPDYYRSFKPYSDEDCLDMRNEVNSLLATTKYTELKRLVDDN
jgi:diadenosine tetraphosphate (Ap4A) HIT family hydrolase